MTKISNIRTALSSYQVSKVSDATIIRRGFFYTNGYTSAKFADKVVTQLADAGITVGVIEHGEVWKPFKGGAPLARQSHWWVKLDVYQPAP